MAELVPRCFQPPERSFFLFGPRGTGKSTLLRSRLKDAVWVDLLEEEEFRKFYARPELLRDVADQIGGKGCIVIDEVQKVPRLLGTVHLLIEKHRELYFVLTGSSARKLKHGQADLLAGRALNYNLHPFIASELGPAFSIQKALTHGMLPLVVTDPDPEKVLASYASLYLKEEVQAEGMTRNVGDFARFLESISFSHAETLNTSNVARECEVKRKTVEAYITILEDLLLSFRLPVFTKRAERATVSHPKFFFFDTGIFMSLRPQGPLEQADKIAGPALEGLVAQHLRAWAAYTDDAHRLYFWKTKAGTEVDLVVYGPEVFWAIEVKCATRVRSEDLRGLKSFAREYPEADRLLLYMGKKKQYMDGILCLPCEDFLHSLVPGRLPEFEGMK
jgi:predicted AAA+ superfamily ATPase